jgi:hypothetical protein
MISSFSEAGYLMCPWSVPRPPLMLIFSSASSSACSADDLFQGAGFLAQFLDLVVGGGPRRVAGQAALAGSRIPSTRRSTGSRRWPLGGRGRRCFLAAQASRTMRILSSAEWCLRVARRMSRTTFSAGGLAAGVEDFWLIFTLLRVTMSQTSSVPQLHHSVSRVLTPDTR